MINYPDEYQEITQTIRRACEQVLTDLGLNWQKEFNISFDIPMNRWEIVFWESWKPCCAVKFARPPSVGQHWYRQEITTLIQKQLSMV
jgi:hypothetical protein